MRLSMVFVPLLWIAASTLAQQPPSISTDRSELGQLLRLWYVDHTAAGNTGDYYDNRDRGHSMLNTSPYPQLQRITYSDEDRKANRDWALATQVLPKVVFGNSSTSASPTMSGSNPRTAYCSPGGLEMLCRQYRGNNLYIYPEHRDHDPDTPVESGYGDLYPTNTSYLIISQGSSGSDRPFMSALPTTLAAFRPDVKQKLIDNGMLMPTVQMILRATSKTIKSPDEYLTGKAHPTVFEGSNVDALRMAKLAHEITADRIPPLVKLKLLNHDPATPGQDYLDPFPSEVLGQTEGDIAMIHRSLLRKRSLEVSAEESIDLNQHPLTFSWVVLRGDPAMVKIQMLNASHTRARITFTWHPVAPIAPGAELTSSRIDVGVFAFNGAYYSAPAFITSFTIPSELRAYAADGRLLEVGYDAAESRFRITDTTALLKAMTQASPAPAVQLLLEGWTPVQIEALQQLADRYEKAGSEVAEAAERKKEADASLAKATADNKLALSALAKVARGNLDRLTRQRNDLVEKKLNAFPAPLNEMILERLLTLAADPSFYPTHAAIFPKLPKDAEAQRKALVALDILRPGGPEAFDLLPLMPGDGPAAGRLSPYQQAQVTRFNTLLLAGAVPGIGSQFRRPLVDFRLTRAKAWRDVYDYTPAGRVSGWWRYMGGKKYGFSAHGLLVNTRDKLGRPLTASPVKYDVTPDKPKGGPWQWAPMTFSAEPTVLNYRYLEDSDRIGQPYRAMP